MVTVRVPRDEEGIFNRLLPRKPDLLILLAFRWELRLNLRDRRGSRRRNLDQRRRLRIKRLRESVVFIWPGLGKRVLICRFAVRVSTRVRGPTGDRLWRRGSCCNDLLDFLLLCPGDGNRALVGGLVHRVGLDLWGCGRTGDSVHYRRVEVGCGAERRELVQSDYEDDGNNNRYSVPP